MIELNEYDPHSSERLLIYPNLSATSSNIARQSEEFGEILQMSVKEVSQNLDQHVSGGYVAFFHGNEGNRRFYTMNKGITRFMPLFS
jgi:hypothetical protein